MSVVFYFILFQSILFKYYVGEKDLSQKNTVGFWTSRSIYSQWSLLSVRLIYSASHNAPQATSESRDPTWIFVVLQHSDSFIFI